jgi:hypothetical protein
LRRIKNLRGSDRVRELDEAVLDAEDAGELLTERLHP